MSDHAWTQDHVAAAVVGGLSAEEAERFDAHVRDCADCAAAVATARRMDGRLTGLFADVRPGPGLEDQVVTLTRTPPGRRIKLVRRFPRWAVAALVLIALGAAGAITSGFVGDGRLPLPGEARTRVAVFVDNSGGMVSGDMASPLYAAKEGAKQDHELWDVTRDERIRPTGKIQTRFGSATPAADGEQKAGEAVAQAKQEHGSTQQPAETPPGGVPNSPATGFNFYGGYFNTNGSTTYGMNGPTANFGEANGRGDLNGTQVLTGVNTYAGGTNATGGTLDLSTKGFDKIPTPNFTGGGGGPVRGVPIQQRPVNGQIQFGGYPVPVQNMPVAPPTGDTSAHRYFSPSQFRSGLVGDVTGAGDKLTKDLPALEKRPLGNQPSDPKEVAKGGQPQGPGAAAAPEPESAAHRVVIRSGEMEFEVTSFDVAVATVTRLAAGMKGAFVATVNSEKLANGKVRGSITVRTPPEHLDKLVLDLRKEIGGDLKGMKVASQDITKQYTDLESRLKAARAMEQRLLQMIKDGKGEIKQLLEAEKELGVWRTRIEEVEGELRYYSNLVSLSTLTITLTEKEIRAAAAVTESERVQAGVEVEDVDKAYQQTLAAVAEAKGRVTKSEVKQLAAGQFNASMQFLVPPDASGPVRDRLRQLGRVARLEIDRSRQDGGEPTAETKVKRGDTLFLVQLYNLANVAPRETATLQIAVPDVRAAFQSLRAAATKAAGRVKVAQLNEQDPQNVTAQLDVEVARAEDGAMRAAVDAAGEVVSRQDTRAPEGDEFTDTKVMFRVTLLAATKLAPREVTAVQVAVPDVRAAYQALRDAAGKSAGRVTGAQLNEQDQQDVTAQLQIEVRRANDVAVRSALDAAGDVMARQVSRAAEAAGTTDAKVLYNVTLVSVARLRPRETTSMTVEVPDVDATAAVFAAQVAEAKGRPLGGQTTRERNGKVTAKLSYEVPLASAGLADRFKSAGVVRAHESSRDPHAPAGKYATARIDVTLTSEGPIAGENEGLWPPIRKGLAYSASVLLTSMTWVVFGLCVVLPWVVVVWGGYRLVRRFQRPAATAAVAPTATQG